MKLEPLFGKIIVKDVEHFTTDENASISGPLRGMPNSEHGVSIYKGTSIGRVDDGGGCGGKKPETVFDAGDKLLFIKSVATELKTNEETLYVVMPDAIICKIIEE